MMTWSIPVLVFFTSIIGWQYFVDHRSVPVGKCYVQYMEDALFNCILQVGYFWITLTAMISLYTGIYQVALQLHRRYELVSWSLTSLFSTNTAISEMKGQGWKVSDILTSTLAVFLFNSHPKKGKGSRGSFKLLR